MDLRRVTVLLRKEFVQSPKNFMIIWVIIAPIVISLLFGLIFGSLVSVNPRLGIYDAGQSRLVEMASELGSISLSQFDSSLELNQAVEGGSVDMGIILPQGFDAAVMSGQAVSIDGYVWGESLASARLILPATISDLVHSLSGAEVPVDIRSEVLGQTDILSWGDRVLPLVVLMAVFLGGLLLPSTSIIEERQKKTLDALTVTPATIGDIYVSKATVAVVLSMISAVIILLINRGFGQEPFLLTAVLLLGATLAAATGLIAGTLVKDLPTLLAIWKGGGIILFAPAIVYMFPQIPEWVGWIFPTYWVINPVVEITLNGGGWAEIALSVFILIGLIAILVGANILALKRKRLIAA